MFGYVRIEVYGFAPERLMNLLIKDNIVIWDVNDTHDGYSFFIGRKNLIGLKPYLKKTNMKFKILTRIGFPYLIKQNRKRVTFIIGCIGFMCAVYTLSLFVWEVRIVGEDHLVANELLKRIEEQYVPLGTFKSKVDCVELEEKLRKDYDEISWISCELKGTGLTVYLEEGIKPKTKPSKDVTGDLVATKNAKITKMITRQGTPVAKVNDKVKKGDILISGTINIYDDNHEVMDTSYVAADGDVYGKTSYDYDDYVDMDYYEKEYYDKEKKHITLYFMDYCLTPFIPTINAANYDTFTQIHKFKIFNDLYLPVGYKVTKRLPYTLKLSSHTEQEATDILNDRLAKKIKQFEENGLEIVKNDVKIEKADNKLVAKGKIVVIEPITTLVKKPKTDKKKVKKKKNK
ncbi:MAG: sporulation protein YqfD [Lachnospiraceae bacterium]|nr:sporulation protein YqfD [Lachnospiraceae bacterium]